MPYIRFEDATRTELRETAPHATVVVPVGSVEQHGPHLPVSADALIVSALADRAAVYAADRIPVIVTPTLPFGFAAHHLPFGGTISVGMSTYIDLLTEIGKSLAAGGFRRIVFLNSHGGNDGPLRVIGDRLVFELGLDIHVATTSYWDCAAEALAELDLDIHSVPGHAGSFETSCLLALRPDLVRADRIPAPEAALQPLASDDLAAIVRRPGVWEVSDGRTDDSRQASAEIGERALHAVSEQIGEFLVRFHRSVEDVT